MIECLFRVLWLNALKCESDFGDECPGGTHGHRTIAVFFVEQVVDQKLEINVVGDFYAQT